MSTIRVAAPNRDRFTLVDRRPVNDESLSFRARGILVWLLDKPDGWKVRSEQIAAAGSEGREAVRSALGELEAAGYLRRGKERDEKGQWRSFSEVRELPQGAPETEAQKPDAGFSGAIASTGTENYTDAAEPSLGAESAQEEQPEKPARARPRNAIFDALAAVYPAGTKSEQSLCGMTAAELARLEPPPEPAEVEARARWAKAEWPTSSPRAVAQHWTMIGERLGGSAPGRREVLERYGRNPAAWPFWDESAMAEIRAAGLPVPERQPQ